MPYGMLSTVAAGSKRVHSLADDRFPYIATLCSAALGQAMVVAAVSPSTIGKPVYSAACRGHFGAVDRGRPGSDVSDAVAA